MQTTNVDLDNNEVIHIELKRGDAIFICAALQSSKDFHKYMGDYWRKINRARSLLMTQVIKNIPDIDELLHPYDLPKD